MKRMLMALLGLAIAAGGLSAQGTKEEAVAAKAEPVEIFISAAASLTDCMNEIKETYTANRPGLTITPNYGSSGKLQQQIEQGAPADIFFSAGKKQMQALEDKGLMAEDTVKDILENKVVVIVPNDSKLAITSVQDLLKPEVGRVAVGEPRSVPVGQYTEETFRNLGMSDAVASKLIYAKDVREVLSWVETDNVDAGLVYETDAKISPKVTIVCDTPEGSHAKVIYPVGVTKESAHPDVAKAFVDYLFSDEAKAIFAKYGFTVI